MESKPILNRTFFMLSLHTFHAIYSLYKKIKIESRLASTEVKPKRIFSRDRIGSVMIADIGEELQRSMKVSGCNLYYMKAD